MYKLFHPLCRYLVVADLRKPDVNDMTALMWAAAEGHYSVCEVLLKAGETQWYLESLFRRAAGSPKDAYLRILMLINVHGHIKDYMKGNVVFFPMMPAVEQCLPQKL